MSVSFKITTFNLRCNVRIDGINMFDIRKGRILEKIDAEKPDLIGFQEMTPPMREYLVRHLPEYGIVGRSRTGDYKGEHVDIAYRRETVDLFGLDFFWLSPTPYVPGSRYAEQSNCPRITTSGIFKLKGLDTPIRLFNTHLDHEGEGARVLGMKQILAKITEENAKFALPTFITGDFNATPDSETIGLCHAYQDMPLTDLTSSLDCTFHNWGKCSSKIDYIFCDSRTAKGFVKVDRWDGDLYGVYYTDHYPVMATLELSDPE